MSDSIEIVINDEDMEAHYEEQRVELDRLFPDVKFTLSIDLEDLDIELSTLDKIIVKNTYNCYCYEDSPPPNDYIEVIKPEGQTHITYRDVIQKMSDIGYNPECNHHFLEGIQQKTPIQFDLWFGS